MHLSVLNDTMKSAQDNPSIGVSEYKLMNILPEELKNTLPSVEDIEARVLKKYDCD